MKATEFCHFFEFSISVSPLEVVPKDERDCLNEKWIYEITDDQGVFRTRYVDNIAGITDCFDSMLQDYIQDNLEEDGFEPDPKENYWEQVLKWMEGNEYKGTDTCEVVQCLLNPALVEDDVKED